MIDPPMVPIMAIELLFFGGVPWFVHRWGVASVSDADGTWGPD